MGRWDILHRDNARDSELGQPREERRQESDGTSVSVGRGPTDSASRKLAEKDRNDPVKARRSGRKIAGPSTKIEAEPTLCAAQRSQP